VQSSRFFKFLDDWPQSGLEEGQPASYFVNQAGQPPQVYTLYNWNRPSGSWALWYRYMNACQALYGEAVLNQHALNYFNNGGDI